MHTPSVSFLNSPPASSNVNSQSRQFADRVYQGLTIVAMLWLLGSLWLFR
jgi:hypothetical protein